jgi:hypothetical protein
MTPAVAAAKAAHHHRDPPSRARSSAYVEASARQVSVL